MQKRLNVGKGVGRSCDSALQGQCDRDDMGFAVLVQFVFAIVVVVVSAFFGQKAMWSAALGSAIAILPNAIFAIYLASSPKAAVYRFFVGEGVKIFIAIAAAAVVWRQYGSQIQPFAYWAGLILVLKAHNFGLLRTVKE